MTGILVERSLLIVALLSVLPLLACSIVSGIVVMVQSIVQVQEQTLVHLARVGVGLGIVALLFPWAGALLTELLQQSFDAMEMIGLQG